MLEKNADVLRSILPSIWLPETPTPAPPMDRGWCHRKPCLSKEQLAVSPFAFSFLRIPKSQIFAFPCSIFFVEIGRGRGGENGLSSPSPSVFSFNEIYTDTEDIIKAEINKNCAGPALLFRGVPTYFSARLLRHWLHPRGSLLLTAVGFGELYISKVQVCSRRELIFALLLKDYEERSPSCPFGGMSLSGWSWFTTSTYLGCGTHMYHL